MTLQQFSQFLLIIQLVLLACTAFVGPFVLRARWLGYLLYTVVAGLLWFAYTIAAMFFDSKVGNDVPGAGYLFLGFVAWLVGSVIYIMRIRRYKISPRVNAKIKHDI